MNSDKKELSANLMPTLPSQRIIALDILRGIAVLGILILNIQSYSMIDAAYINPTAYGNLTGLNRWVWILGRNRRRVLLWAWETLFPVTGRLPVTWQTLDMVESPGGPRRPFKL